MVGHQQAAADLVGGIKAGHGLDHLTEQQVIGTAVAVDTARREVRLVRDAPTNYRSGIEC